MPLVLRILTLAAALESAFAISASVSKIRERHDDPSNALEKTHGAAVQAADDAVMVGGVLPVPTTTRCVVIILCQYMIIYMSLAICRSYHELTASRKGTVEGALLSAAQSMTYGPMVCVLFIGCRMTVEFLSGGTGQPQRWVQRCMYFVTFSVMINTLIVMIVPLVTGRLLAMKEGTFDLEKPAVRGNRPALVVLNCVRYLVLVGLYGGLAGVIMGTFTYTPSGVVDSLSLPPPAPAVICTVILALNFFLTQIVIALARSYDEFTGRETVHFVEVMSGAAETVEFAPMLAIVYLAARMRALQFNGQPQSWAHHSMYASTAALGVMTFLAIAVPLCMGGRIRTNPATNDTTFEVTNLLLGRVLMVFRYLLMTCLYIGFAAVIVSIYLFESSPGVVPPISPTVHCVCNICCQYFFIYGLLMVCTIISELSGGNIPLERSQFFAAVVASKATVALAPMLCILFVTTRMYALLITDKKGAPQAWVQDAMCMCTWSLLISFVLCLATGVLSNRLELDDHGNVVNKFSNRYLRIVMKFFRILCMALLYAGIITIVVGIFQMTPATANGRGSIPIVTDAVKWTPIGYPPPAPNWIATIGSF